MPHAAVFSDAALLYSTEVGLLPLTLTLLRKKSSLTLVTGPAFWFGVFGVCLCPKLVLFMRNS